MNTQGEEILEEVFFQVQKAQLQKDLCSYKARKQGYVTIQIQDS